MKRLFLDDVRDPLDCRAYMPETDWHESWYIVRDYESFVAWIEANGLPDVVSFDHDLAKGHYHKNMQQGQINYGSEDFETNAYKTGWHCANWMVHYCIERDLALPQWRVHSWNPVGKENIEGLLRNAERTLCQNSLL